MKPEIAYTRKHCGSRTDAVMRKRLEMAEAVCREFRHAITQRQAEQDWSRLTPFLIAWLKVAPNDLRYSTHEPQ